MTLDASTDGQGWRFLHFGLIVTGKTEEQCLPSLFRSISATGKCSFKVIRRIGQRSPITAPERKLQMTGSSKTIPDRDAEDIGFPARKFLSSETNFVILVDDLEANRTGEIQQIFDRYRRALDRMLQSDQIRHRASVHFFVNMLEAYYFADARSVNAALGTELEDFEGDVETIRNPKSELRKLYQGFNEIEHGCLILNMLRAPHVLSRQDACASLRTMFAWIFKAIGEPEGETYQLLEGRYSNVTKDQLRTLAQ